MAPPRHVWDMRAGAGDMNPVAPSHLPFFITAPGDSDQLMQVVAAFLVLVLVMAGILYLKLHALPEQMAHRGQKVQMQLVAVLALIALFTHDMIFWLAALLLAVVEFPEWGTPLRSIADSLERLSGRSAPPDVPPAAAAEPEAARTEDGHA